MITPKEPYRDSRLKIDRANQHIINLQELIDTFVAGKNHQFVFDFSLQVLKVEVKPLPDGAGLILGDALHNLRSAIDCAYYATVLRAGCTPNEWTQLPFFPTRQKLADALAGGSIKKSLALRNFVVDQVRPYRASDESSNTGNEILVALHDLNVIDKHIVMPPFVDVTQVKGAKIQVGGLMLDGANVTVERGTVTSMAKFFPPVSPRNVRFSDHGKLSGDVLFDKGLPFEGKPVIAVLHQLRDVATSLVKGFDALRFEP